MDTSAIHATHATTPVASHTGKPPFKRDQMAQDQTSPRRPNSQNTSAGGALSYLTNNPDLFLAVGILLILSLLVVPLPAFMLDMLLALNITISILILMVGVYLKSPLDMASFPTVLLMTTLFRLGLNLATTRLILSDGHAGEIIKAFGSFVIAGNYVVGTIVFMIIMIINFVVIIKGSTRIAEVTARFTLDAMPGKQMSIDADLNAGYITEVQARERRTKLTQESEFYGAMDGASKFVKGDAVAGLIIIAINVIGGFAIGVGQKGMTLANALEQYTLLTIGDGLVSQIPALLVSVAAGLIVTRGSSGENLDKEITQQFGKKPKALGVASGALGVLSLLPGFPMLPFLALSAGAGALAYFRQKEIEKEENQLLIVELNTANEEKNTPPEEKPVEDLLHIDPIEVNIGYGLIPLVDESQGGNLFKRITNIRRQLATELGIVVPAVRVRDNLNLDPEDYIVSIRGNDIARNQLYPQQLLAMNPGTADGELRGRYVTEPVFGLPATWIQTYDRENAEIMGFTVIEPATVFATHLTELLRRNADRLLTRQDVKNLVENMKKDYSALVEEMTPDALPIGTLQKVLQNLLREGIPIRDLPIICEALLEYTKVTKNIDVLSEYVRHNLSETIKRLYQDNDSVIHVMALDASFEHNVTTALQTSQQAASSPTLGLSPDQIRAITKSVSKGIDEMTMAGYNPVVACSAPVRPYFYRMIHSTFPMVSVISYTELPSDADIDVVFTVGANSFVEAEAM